MYFYYEPARLTLSFFSTIAAVHDASATPSSTPSPTQINQEIDEDKRDRARAPAQRPARPSSCGAAAWSSVSSLAVTGPNVASWTIDQGLPVRAASPGCGRSSDALLRYTLVRLAQAVLVLWVVVTVVFLLSRAAGNIAELMAPPDAPPETVALIEENLGLDKPLIVQYGRYLGDLLHGDLGQSFAYRAPVTDLIREALPNTIQLGVAAFAFAVVFGIPIGVLSAMRPGGWFDQRRQGRRPRRAVGAELLARHPARAAVLGAARVVAGVRRTARGSTSCCRRSPSAGTRWPRWPGSPARP